ncbi:MAG: hypothetical protein KDK04_04645, partial [Candidatus Competibacteraceae bacterium]|nr:hypothetical protein [Candidatus Competibacteraceae bacterium]
QIMRLGWKVFIPITIVWIFVLGIGIVTKTSPGFEIAVLALAGLVGIVAKLTQNVKKLGMQS